MKTRSTLTGAVAGMAMTLAGVVVGGLFPAGAQSGGAPAGFVASSPQRIFDSRALGGRWQADTAGVIGTPAPPGATAVAVNITMSQTEGPGYLTVGAAETSFSMDTSILNSQGVGDVANFAIVPIKSTAGFGQGNFVIYTSTETHVIVDYMGYFTGGDFVPQQSAQPAG